MDGCWLYILRCSDGRYCTGTTRLEDVQTRVSQHGQGQSEYTAKRTPVTLVFAERFERITDAIAAERRLKGWSRVKKEALIAGKFDLLPELARRGYRPRIGRLRSELETPSSFETAALRPPQSLTGNSDPSSFLARFARKVGTNVPENLGRWPWQEPCYGPRGAQVPSTPLYESGSQDEGCGGGEAR
jgi:putative endonuclease